MLECDALAVNDVVASDVIDTVSERLDESEIDGCSAERLNVVVAETVASNESVGAKVVVLVSGTRTVTVALTVAVVLSDALEDECASEEDTELVPRSELTVDEVDMLKSWVSVRVCVTSSDFEAVCCRWDRDCERASLRLPVFVADVEFDSDCELENESDNGALGDAVGVADASGDIECDDE